MIFDIRFMSYFLRRKEIAVLRFVCQSCKDGQYDNCPGGTRCDVNHEARKRKDAKSEPR